jgi:hypothetical protein
VTVEMIPFVCRSTFSNSKRSIGMSDRSKDDMARFADATRSRVAEALKETIETDLVMSPPIVMGHSKYEHVIKPAEEEAEARRRDEELMSSVWGSDDEAKIDAFAARLAALRDKGEAVTT